MKTQARAGVMTVETVKEHNIARCKFYLPRFLTQFICNVAPKGTLPFRKSIIPSMTCAKCGESNWKNSCLAQNSLKPQVSAPQECLESSSRILLWAFNDPYTTEATGSSTGLLFPRLYLKTLSQSHFLFTTNVQTQMGSDTLPICRICRTYTSIFRAIFLTVICSTPSDFMRLYC